LGEEILRAELAVSGGSAGRLAGFLLHPPYMCAFAF
jgi:hypothetical protein